MHLKLLWRTVWVRLFYKRFENCCLNLLFWHWLVRKCIWLFEILLNKSKYTDLRKILKTNSSNQLPTLVIYYLFLINIFRALLFFPWSSTPLWSSTTQQSIRGGVTLWAGGSLSPQHSWFPSGCCTICSSLLAPCGR